MEQNVYINSEPSAEVTIYQNGTPITLVFDAEFLVWGDLIGNISDQTDLQAELDLKVPYTGATGNVNLGEYGLTTGYVQFDTTPTTYNRAVGNLGWNDTDGTIEFLLKGGNVDLPIGEKSVARVVNGTGGNVLKSNYQVVKVTGAQGQRLQVNLAQANNDANSADTLGLIAENINNNNTGFIITSGLLENINTTGSLQSETWSDGDILYLSGTVAGKITNVKPQAPIHTIIIGFVAYAHQNNGKIFVKVDNGYELDELHNVKINTGTLSNGQVLKYNSSLGVWENNTDAAGTGTVTQVNATGGTGISVSGSPITTSGTLTITNTAPDQVVSLTQGGTTTITGTYPNFTVSSADQYQGTVTSASVVSANGFAGTVANSTTTPAITLSTSVTGLLKGDGTAISAAVAGTDYQAALTNPVTGTGTSGQVSYWTGTTSQSGSNNLFWDNANGRLGIGTSTPTNTLDVNGTARIQGNLTTNLTSGSVPFIGASGLMTQDNSNLFWDNTNKRLGIGTSTPEGSVHASYINFTDSLLIERIPTFTDSLAASARLRASYTTSPSTGAGPAFSFQLKVGSTVNDIAAFGAGRDGADNSGYLSFSTRTSGVQSEKMQVRANGNVIIQNGGTFTDAGFRLDVNGTARIVDSLSFGEGGSLRGFVGRPSWNTSYVSFQNLTLTNSAANSAINQSSTGDTIVNCANGRGLYLRVNNSNQLSLTSNLFTLNDTLNIAFGTTTGTKIGTSTSQKLAFYNSAPIVQPTTGVAAATRVNVAGNTVTDADTFDGYTIPQLVKAMRNLGLLA